jgi:predicted AlkP superfamily phosphohydrolase/phosphomutase
MTVVYRPSQIYSGPFVGEAPDLVVGYNAGYRASWDTVLGGYPMEHVLDNTDPWSGDHAMDAVFLPGCLLANCKLSALRPGLEDLAPSILARFGARIPEGMTRRNVF